MSEAPWRVMAESAFVSLGTYKRSGERVSVPVWIAPDGDDLVVTSERMTGKVKRLRRDSRVMLQPCSRFGAVEPDAPSASGTGVIVDDDPRAVAALARKYGMQFRLVLGLERLIRRIQRRDAQRVILRISPSDQDSSAAQG